MKFLSKMNSRDRNLLVLLAAVVIFFLCYTLIMTPSMEKANLLKGEIETVKAELLRAESLADKEGELENQAAELREELLDKYSVFFTDLNQANVLNRLDNMMYGTGFAITSYIPSEVAVSQVLVESGAYVPLDYPLLNLARNIDPERYEGVTPEQTASDGVGEDSSDKIPCLELTINYDNTAYETVYSFINAVEKMDKTVIIKSLDFAKGDEGPGLQGQMILDLYSLPGFDKSQSDSLEFTTVIPKGKPNPFN